MAEPSLLLELCDVGARLDDDADVEGLSLSVAPGEIVGLVGNRGAGKRAVLDLVVGTRFAHGGEIRFRGRDISRVPPLGRARRGLVSPLQQPSRWERVRDAVWEPKVGTIVARGLNATGIRVGRRERAVRIEAMLQRVGLTGVQRLVLRELSAGMDLRVRLAQLMIQKPRLIIIDEPFKAWDSITRQACERLLMDLCQEEGMSFLISDRSWGVLRMCDRAYVIDAHRIVDEGSPDQIAKWFDVGESRGLYSPNIRTAFISYRRDDNSKFLYRIYEALVSHFGSHAIWRDILNIRPGSEFKEEIAFAVRKCDVLLAVIGPRWAGEDSAGQMSRLFEPDDPIRMEIGLALEHGVPIVPLLIDGGKVPSADRLPEVMRSMTDYQTLTVRRPPDFDTDIRALIEAIEFLKAKRDAKRASG